MITKNNQDSIEKAISSVKNLVDEIIIADTGSEDNTKKIAGEYTDKIFDFSWNFNFSEAKNFVVSKAVYDWILNLDADETISEKDSEKIKLLVENADKKTLGFSFIQRNYNRGLGNFSSVSCVDDEYDEAKIAPCFTPRRIVRLFKNHPEIKFQGNVHDSPEKSILKLGKIHETGIPIHHFGMLNRSPERTKMYIDIEKKNLKPDFFQHYQIASQLHSIGKTEQAIRFLNSSIKLNPCFHLSWLELGIIYIKRGMISEALKSLKKAESLGSHEMIFSHLGVVYGMLENFPLSENYFNKALSINNKNADTHFNLGLTLQNQGKTEQAEKEFKKSAYLNPVYKQRISKFI
jgi:glycosyltransferase involved in cell wall biosynthesis